MKYAEDTALDKGYFQWQSLTHIVTRCYNQMPWFSKMVEGQNPPTDVFSWIVLLYLQAYNGCTVLKKNLKID